MMKKIIITYTGNGRGKNYRGKRGRKGGRRGYKGKGKW